MFTLSRTACQSMLATTTAAAVALMSGSAHADGGSRLRSLSWADFAHKKPGAPVVVASADGRWIQGRVLASAGDAVLVVDFTGRRMSSRAEQGRVRELRRARLAAGDVPAGGADDAPEILRVTRDDGSMLFEPQRRSVLGAVFKVVGVVASVYFLLLLGLLVAYGRAAS